MSTLHSYRGDPARNEDHLTEPLTIVFDQRVPPIDRVLATEDHDAYMLRGATFYATAAAAIVDAMSGQLPGGLLDALFADLARRKAGIFRVVVPTHWRDRTEPDNTAIRELADVLGIDIVIRRPAGQDGRHMARFNRCDILEGSLVGAAYGNGPTPETALADYAKRIAGRRMVFDVSGDQRREFDVPVSLGSTS